MTHALHATAPAHPMDENSDMPIMRAPAVSRGTPAPPEKGPPSARMPPTGTEAHPYPMMMLHGFAVHPANGGAARADPLPMGAPQLNHARTSPFVPVRHPPRNVGGPPLMQAMPWAAFGGTVLPPARAAHGGAWHGGSAGEPAPYTAPVAMSVPTVAPSAMQTPPMTMGMPMMGMMGLGMPLSYGVPPPPPPPGTAAAVAAAYPHMAQAAYTPPFEDRYLSPGEYADDDHAYPYPHHAYHQPMPPQPKAAAAAAHNPRKRSLTGAAHVLARRHARKTHTGATAGAASRRRAHTGSPQRSSHSAGEEDLELIKRRQTERAERAERAVRRRGGAVGGSAPVHSIPPMAPKAFHFQPGDTLHRSDKTKTGERMRLLAVHSFPHGVVARLTKEEQAWFWRMPAFENLADPKTHIDMIRWKTETVFEVLRPHLLREFITLGNASNWQGLFRKNNICTVGADADHTFEVRYTLRGKEVKSFTATGTKLILSRAKVETLNNAWRAEQAEQAEQAAHAVMAAQAVQAAAAALKEQQTVELNEKRAAQEEKEENERDAVAAGGVVVKSEEGDEPRKEPLAVPQNENMPPTSPHAA